MELPCVVHRVITRKNNGFAVLAATLDRFNPKYSKDMEAYVKDAISKKYGTFSVIMDNLDINEDPSGSEYVFVGEMESKPSYGVSFRASMHYRDIPSTTDGMEAFLTILPHIGRVRAKAIIKEFGLDGTIELLNGDNIYALTRVSGITKKMIDGDGKKEGIQKAWNRQKAMRKLYEWLNAHGVSVKIGEKAFKIWGDNAQSVIEKNPYVLTSIRGVGFIIADKIAHQIASIMPNERSIACLKYILTQSVYEDSNLCIPYSSAKHEFLDLLEKCDINLGNKFDSKLYQDLLPNIIKTNLNTFVVVRDTRQGKPIPFLYLRNIWEKELFVSTQMASRWKNNVKGDCCSDLDIDDAEKNISLFYGKKIVLDECQKQAIKSAFNNSNSIITGSGGTGKSMICRCIYYLAGKKNMTIRMMSPTGKAAQVLSAKTGGKASTIHRSLGILPDSEYPTEEIFEDIVLIDEISMSGIDTMHAILFAMQNHPLARLVMVGDKNQLPSVSPGNFLSDIIEAQCINIVTLEKIHRQDEKSYIPLIANQIAKGKCVQIPSDASDISWHNLSTDTFDSDIINYMKKYFDDGKDIEDLQIISPMKKGKCGVFQINKIVQEFMTVKNGSIDKFLEIGFNKYYNGDRIMQIENNYEKNVFNGDIGKIVNLGERISYSTGKKERFIVVDFYGKEYEYVDSEFDQLMLAWCITVHKFQGSQCPYIVCVIASEASIMMSKELIYTSFTRCEKHLDIFGHQSTFSVGTTKSSIRMRYTNTSKIINEYLTNEKILQVLS